MVKSWPFWLIIFLIVFGVGISRFVFLLGPASAAAAEKTLEIKSGEGFNLISSRLEQAGIIKSVTAFKIYAFFSGAAHRLKPGVYDFNSASSTPEVLRNLISGPRKEIKIIIPEGYTLLDIDSRLSDFGIISAGELAAVNIKNLKGDYEFLASAKSLEGFMFPDTYLFFEKTNPTEVAKKFLDNFNQKIWPLIKDHHSTAGSQSIGPAELITLASIIEKEVPDGEEKSNDRRLVSGIYYKRLKIGMALQADITLVYIKCGKAYHDCEQPALYRRDMSMDSLYNTYTHKGLPPGPISNPGKDAMESALNPLKSDYLFYISDPETKATIFAKTLDEHNQNSVKYLDTH
ncbi:MAG: endolytic transglycosylase MltG [Candidatus Pacebacteria bacterium]|nr:endolytic transglycosylase MltG [Candidatus Paceibacterota bacterium]